VAKGKQCDQIGHNFVIWEFLQPLAHSIFKQQFTKYAF